MTTASQMGKKPPAEVFDHCVIVIDDYHRFLVPKRAALAFFEGMLGKDMYRLESWYDQGNSFECVEEVQPGNMPILRAYSVVQFHMALANTARRAEAKRNKDASK